MGEVFLAEDTRLGRKVALKLLPQGLLADPEIRRRFSQEARAVSALNHPQIVTIDRKSTRLNSSHLVISYAVFCLKKKKHAPHRHRSVRRSLSAFSRSRPMPPNSTPSQHNQQIQCHKRADNVPSGRIHPPSSRSAR